MMKKYKFNQEHSMQQNNGTDRDLPEVSPVRQSRRNRKQKAFLKKSVPSPSAQFSSEDWLPVLSRV